jgi:hypothetical protein
MEHEPRLETGGSTTLSVTGICREGGGDAASMRPRSRELLVNIAHSRKFHEWGVRLRALPSSLGRYRAA